jgi:lipid II isoglutaminyl synthase (glutamine-hydrolysing)
MLGAQRGPGRLAYPRRVRAPIPLGAEILAARAVGGLSRLLGAGGGTTLPGKLLWKLDPSAVDRLAERLPLGSALISATNGKTTTAALVAAILEPRTSLAHNAAGANLVSGIASTLLAAGEAQLGLFEVDEGALPEVARRVRPRAVCLGNLFRDQLDRYGELELVAARWREAVRRLASETAVVVNGDDPQVGDLGRERPGALVFGLDDPRHAQPSLQHAADSKYCLRCGTPYEYRAAYVGHLGDYRCPQCGHGRPQLDVVARAIELDGLEGAAFDLVAPGGSARVRLSLPGLYNVYNALAAGSLSLSLGATLESVRQGLESAGAAFGRFERIPIGDKRLLMLLIKNPAGANEVIRTLVSGGAPKHAVVALNDATADGKDVSWIWDVDFEPLLEGLDTVLTSGDRAAELALRFRYAGFDRRAIEVVPHLEEALDRGLELTAAGGELVALPTYTAMLALRKIVAGRGFARPYWERAA